MLARVSAFLIWALVASALMFWGLRLMVSAPAAPSYAVAVGDVAVAKGDLAALLGATPVTAPVVAAAPAAASRFRLLGIVAPKYPGQNIDQASTQVGQGVALIAVDGKMPRAYSVGAKFDGDLTLKSLTLRTVSIGDAKSDSGAITLELPALPNAATGMLPMAGGESRMSAPPSSGLPMSLPNRVGAPGFAPAGQSITPQSMPQMPVPSQFQSPAPQSFPAVQNGGAPAS